MNSAILMQSSGVAEQRPLAYQRLFRVLDLSPTAHSDRVYFNLGMLGMDDGDSANAELWFKKAINIKPNFRSALFNLALLLNEQKRALEALPFLISLHSFYPDHVKGLILMGDIYTNHVKDLKAAEKCYRLITEVDPNHVQGHHNLCVVLVEQGHLEQARECLLKVMDMAPSEEYIKRHLQIVENRIRAAATAATAKTFATTD
jgi:tetratricopeptide (TPR) repeat protein